MLDSKVYIKVLFSLLLIVMSSAIMYVIYFMNHYPLPITNRISFDAKLKFVRDHIDVDKIDTIIVGSSIGLNDIQGTYLEKESKKCKGVLNLSVYEATTLEAEQLLELRRAFPNLQRMIYSAQYSDMPHPYLYKEYNSEILSKYMAHKLGLFEYLKLVFDAAKNIPFLIQRQNEWSPKHTSNNSFYYLGFDSSGSVPLHIYGKDIIQHRWRNPHPNIEHPKSFEALARIAKIAQEEGLYFYFAHQPYRIPLYEKYKRVSNGVKYVDKRVEEIFKSYPNAKLIRLQELHMGDEYFADRTHLNDKGSIVTAKAIAKFIDKNEK
jgi:hypothetical protein